MISSAHGTSSSIALTNPSNISVHAHLIVRRRVSGISPKGRYRLFLAVREHRQALYASPLERHRHQHDKIAVPAPERDLVAADHAPPLPGVPVDGALDLYEEGGGDDTFIGSMHEAYNQCFHMFPKMHAEDSGKCVHQFHTIAYSGCDRARMLPFLVK
jgi:hypothetical protein